MFIVVANAEVDVKQCLVWVVFQCYWKTFKHFIAVSFSASVFPLYEFSELLKVHVVDVFVFTLLDPLVEGRIPAKSKKRSCIA